MKSWYDDVGEGTGVAISTTISFIYGLKQSENQRNSVWSVLSRFPAATSQVPVSLPLGQTSFD